MSRLRSERIRKGRGLCTTIISESHGTNDSCTFFEVDNLDTKTLEEAENSYEKTFITVRNFLEKQKNEQHNLASEAARLTFAQDITDLLRKNNLINKEEK